MSHYNKIKTQITNRDALIKALGKMGYKESQVEVHEEAQHLYGYQGDKRPQKANVIVRRKNVGGAANDIGWELQEDGTYQAMISDYDKHKHSTEWQNKLGTHYNVEQSKSTFEQYGWSWTESVTEEGELQVVGVQY